MSAAPAIVSVGDEGVLSAHVSPSLSDVWIDRDLSWLDFNERILAEAIDERTPLLERAHPVPFLSKLSTSLVFLLHDPDRAEHMYARIKVPSVLRQWIPLQAGVRASETIFVSLHEVIRGNSYKLYNTMELTATTLMRLTRDAEVEIDDGSDATLSELVCEQIRARRYEPVVRLELAPDADSAIHDMLQTHFDLSPVDIYDMPDEVDYTTLFEIATRPLPALREPVWSPITPPALANGKTDLFAVIQANDLLVHHPYSFDASVEHFIHQAADDPQTVAIKMTVYRIGDDTPFVRSLIKAAETGKQVACVIELKARFDGERNLHWAAELQRVGAHVISGVRGLKTHAKTALVVRQEPSGLRSYAHIGTGNYPVRTARLYTDVGLFTCDPALTRDVVHLFHYLTGHSQTPHCDQLLLAPSTMRSRFLELIKREIDNQRAGRPARIVAEMNQLEDPEIIDICLRDQRQAWLLKRDGRYAPVCMERAGEAADAIATHSTLMELTRRRSHPLPQYQAKRPASR